jgi:5-methylcytosine-specific restriction endonuclease McrA
MRCAYCYSDIVGDPYRLDNLIFCNEICYNRLQIMRLFKWRCALNPSHAANTVHEIVPRSLRPKNWWDTDNMIPLCWNCHDDVHRQGTRNFANKLRKILEDAHR